MPDGNSRAELIKASLLERETFVKNQKTQNSLFVTANREAFGKPNGQELRFMTSLLANLEFGIALAEIQMSPDQQAKSEVQFDTNPSYSFDNELLESADSWGLMIKYLSSPVEYSALAARRVVAKWGFPQYVGQYDAIWDKVVQYRREYSVDLQTISGPNRDEEMPPPAIYYSPDKGNIFVNIAWLLGVTRNLDKRFALFSGYLGGIKYDNPEDAMVFIGIEERFHEVFNSKKQASTELKPSS